MQLEFEENDETEGDDRSYILFYLMIIVLRLPFLFIILIPFETTSYM